VKVLAEIPPPASPPLRAGTLRRRDLEAFDRLRDRLEGTGSVLFAGAAPGRGAVALGLATAAVAAGARTILVECDLAEPALADSLDIARAPGLGEHLRGEAEAAAVLRPVVLAGPGSAAAGEPLVCVAAGRPAPDASALLSSGAFADAVARMRSEYELVVLDGPSPADAEGVLAAAGQAERVLAVGARREVPRWLRALADGLVVPRAGG
jgi:Mrp family chromosome partitioning ATPase